MTNTKMILLIGRSGRGKSTLANVITNTNNFEESSESASKTRKIQFEEFEENNLNYQIIDTPGIGDTKLKQNEVLDIIAEAIYLVKDGLSQVFFVTNGRFDQSEMATYDLLRTIIFDQDITSHTTIVRTRFNNFKKPDKCQADIDLMIKEAKEKKVELERNIVAKENKLTNRSSDSEEHQKLMVEIAQVKKELMATNLAEIIESCQEKVVYVDNPSLEDEEKLEINQNKRSKSRGKLLEHLTKTCQGDAYKPQKLQGLSTEIADDMDKLLESRRELEAELAKLATNNSSLVDHQLAGVASSENKLTNISNKSETVVTKNNERKPITDAEDKLAIGEKITRLENVREKLEKEIAEKEKVIRQKVLKHIFDNYGAINNEIGGDIFLGSVIGEHD
jgi:GTP-binding protein EngB required for normal cell division